MLTSGDLRGARTWSPDRGLLGRARACVMVAFLVALMARGVVAEDAVMTWNAIALQAVVDDHSGTYGSRQQGGPTRASRALAIVHIAIYDAVNAIDGSAEPYIPVSSPASRACMDAAVAKAARDTLVALYPNQRRVFERKLAKSLEHCSRRRGRAAGIAVGAEAAANILAARSVDGAANGDTPIYPPTGDPPLPGEHQPDPLNPGQGLLTPGWGRVATFSGIDVTTSDIRIPPPPPLNSSEYAAAFVDVQMLGGDGVVTPTLRTEEQTEIGLFWAYDGARGIGVPPVLYNQVARTIAHKMTNTIVENARLLALVNIAMADAGIACWDCKYLYNVWRPVVGIRNAAWDDNPATDGVEDWTPLGAPASNQSGNDFTPPFPSYPSGHATFGGALFRMLANFYDRDRIHFRLRSDELNGRTTDSHGIVRPLVVRHFDSFSAAAIENARSRIYLGIHWQFDADQGTCQGVNIADAVYSNLLQP